MAFSDYKTISQVQAEYKIKYDEINFIPIKEHNVPDILIVRPICDAVSGISTERNWMHDNIFKT